MSQADEVRILLSRELSPRCSRGAPPRDGPSEGPFVTPPPPPPMSCAAGYSTTAGFVCDYTGARAICPAGSFCPVDSYTKMGLGVAIKCPDFQEDEELGWGLRLFCGAGYSSAPICPDGYVCARVSRNWPRGGHCSWPVTPPDNLLRVTLRVLQMSDSASFDCFFRRSVRTPRTRSCAPLATFACGAQTRPGRASLRGYPARPRSIVAPLAQAKSR